MEATPAKWYAARAAFEAARARELERRERTGYCDGWWDAPHYVQHWLKHETEADGTEGELMADMRADPDLPHHFPTLKRMRDYVRLKSKGDPLAMATVLDIWRRYRKWGRRLSPRLF
jgi:hypothetical protein